MKEKKTGRRWQMSVESWTKRSEEKMKGVSKKKKRLGLQRS